MVLAGPTDPDWFSQIEAARVVSSADEIAWTDTADFVVVGYGGAGVSAALEASEKGLSVVAVDCFDGGGATRINGGVFYAGGGTLAQHEAGVTDSVEDMFQYLRLETQGVVDDSTLRRFCDTSVETVEWMTRHGVKFNGRLYAKKTSYPHSSFYLYHPDNSLAPAYAAVARAAPRGHRAFVPATSSAIGYGVGLYDPLRAAAEQAGVRLLKAAEARQLVLDGSGRVLGVKIVQVRPGSKEAERYFQLQGRATNLMLKMPPAIPGAGIALRLAEKWFEQARAIQKRIGIEMFIRATRGLCLSTGGFIFNRRMVARYAPKYLKGMPLGTPGDDGSGIRLGQSAGGAVDRLGSVTAWRFINPPYAWAKGMIVDATGRRYVNETLYGASIGQKMVEDHDGVAWLILDQRLIGEAWAQTKDKLILPFQKYPAMMAMLLGRKKSATLQSLARKCGFDANIFLSEIDAYNAGARGIAADRFQKAQEDMCAIEQGPYYAVNMSIDATLAPLPVLTLGGLKVDETSGEVLRDNGQAIAGLYAAGRTAVGVCSNIYVSGLSAADCVFSGRRAAAHAGGLGPRLAHRQTE